MLATARRRRDVGRSVVVSARMPHALTTMVAGKSFGGLAIPEPSAVGSNGTQLD
jgi:hypothetical protein